ncbi:MAG: carboxypeptidase regulatory-like domain-containing protein [Planctomycetes bacterium]|nr:carboxypeptidase regulatory-like domain-containing protein [Planctomycetota bacterium]
MRIFVTDRVGIPIPNACIQFYEHTFLENSVIVNPTDETMYERWLSLLRTNREGLAVFRLPLCGAGPPRANVHAEGFAAISLKLPDVSKGQFIDVRIPLQRAWILEGWVRGVAPSHIADLELSCEFEDVDGEESEIVYDVDGKRYVCLGHQVTIEVDGHFRYPCVPAGAGVNVRVEDSLGRYELVETLIPPRSAPVEIPMKKDPPSGKGFVQLSFPNGHQGSDYSVTIRDLLNPGTVLEPVWLGDSHAYDRALYRYNAWPFVGRDPRLQKPSAYRDDSLLLSAGRRFNITLRGRAPDLSSAPPGLPLPPNEYSDFDVTVLEDQTQSVTPEFRSGAKVVGKVVESQTGRGIPAASVYLLVDGQIPEPHVTMACRATTDEEGRFTYPGLSPGPQQFAVRSPKFQEGRFDVILAPEESEEVTVKLDPSDMPDVAGTVTITGTISDSTTGEPISGASVTVSSPSGKGTRVTQSVRGTFSIAYEKTSPIELRVESQGYETWKQWITADVSGLATRTEVKLIRHP